MFTVLAMCVKAAHEFDRGVASFDQGYSLYNLDEMIIEYRRFSDRYFLDVTVHAPCLTSVLVA